MDANNLSLQMVQRVGLLGKAVELRRDWARALAVCGLSDKRSNSRRLPVEVLRNIVSMLLSSQQALRQADGQYEDSDDESEPSDELQDVVVQPPE
jgi:hypothetical protein